MTTSFLGSQALRGGHSPALAWLALIVFAATSGTCLAVLWPRPWEVGLEPREIVQAYVDEGAVDLGLVYRDLALHLDKSMARNSTGLGLLGRLLQSAGLLLSLDIALWFFALAVGA